jgi:NAD-reducing hydrogenase large subunit
VQNCDRITTPRAEAARRRFVAGGMVHGTLAYHHARMIEMLHAMEVIAELLDDDAVLGGGGPLTAALPPQPAGPRRGVGVIEAPRGTLIHDYTIGADDLVTHCNLIVSTTHNNQAMNESVRAVAALPRRPRADRGAAQPHRGRDPRLRPLPELRHARARRDAAGR